MSKCAGRFQKHPFFVNDGKPSNFAGTIYQEALKAQSSSATKKKRPMTGFELFRQTMETSGDKTFQMNHKGSFGSVSKLESLRTISHKKKKLRVVKDNSQFTSIRNQVEEDDYGYASNNYNTMYQTSSSYLPVNIKINGNNEL